MAKIARLFTIDQEVHARAKRALPNMSQVVENALRDAVTSMEDEGQPNPLKGVSRKLLNRAASIIGQEPAQADQRSEKWAQIINHKCGTNIQPQHILNYATATELIR